MKLMITWYCSCWLSGSLSWLHWDTQIISVISNTCAFPTITNQTFLQWKRPNLWNYITCQQFNIYQKWNVALSVNVFIFWFAKLYIPLYRMHIVYMLRSQWRCLNRLLKPKLIYVRKYYIVRPVQAAALPDGTIKNEVCWHQCCRGSSHVTTVEL